MRESFGGAFMLKLAITFLIIYVSFMAVAVNYAKAFRVKNQIINILEQNQYGGVKDDLTKNIIFDYLKDVHYNVGSVECPSDRRLDAYGFCIEGHDNNQGSSYYRVTTYISIDFPFFGIKMTLPIRGETKTIIT